MRIDSAVKQEDCFDGDSAARYWFDEAWTRASIQHLAALGKLDYFSSFPRPFFRVVSKSGMQVKGVEGDKSCLVVFPKGGREAAIDEFERQFK